MFECWHSRMKHQARIVTGLCAGALLFAGASVAFAQSDSFPTKNLTVLVWSSAGGKADLVTRAMTPLLAKILGQDVVVKNVVGGGGTAAVNQLVAQPADGYTMLTVSPTLPALYSEPGVTFTPDDIQPVCVTSTVPFTIMVPANSPFHTLKDLITYAKANPGKLNVGGPFAIGSHRVQWVQFQEAAGIQATWIPFDGSKEADLAVAGGNVDAGTSTKSRQCEKPDQSRKGEGACRLGGPPHCRGRCADLQGGGR